MQTLDPKPFKECLNEAGLGTLVARAQQILAIKTLLQQWLPSELAPHCQVLNIHQGRLVLSGPSAAFITRLRYSTPEILDFLNSQSDLPTIHQVIYKVIPFSSPPIIARPQTKPVLSSATLKLLTEMATNTQHPQLKKSLQKIAAIEKFTA